MPLDLHQLDAGFKILIDGQHVIRRNSGPVATVFTQALGGDDDGPLTRFTIDTDGAEVVRSAFVDEGLS